MLPVALTASSLTSDRLRGISVGVLVAAVVLVVVVVDLDTSRLLSATCRLPVNGGCQCAPSWTGRQSEGTTWDCQRRQHQTSAPTRPMSAVVAPFAPPPPLSDRCVAFGRAPRPPGGQSDARQLGGARRTASAENEEEQSRRHGHHWPVDFCCFGRQSD